MQIRFKLMTYDHSPNIQKWTFQQAWIEPEFLFNGLKVLYDIGSIVTSRVYGRGNAFVVSVCSGSCSSWHRNLIFGAVVHLHNIQVKFEYRHQVKVKVISWKMLNLLLGCQFNLVRIVWGQGHTKVKVNTRSNCKCLTFYQQAGGGPSTERHSWCLCVHFTL